MLSRRRSAPLATLIALLICFALLSSGFAPFAIGEAKGVSWTGQGQSRGARPVAGAPEAHLPNLSEARQARPRLLNAPAPIPSIRRSRRNPLAPRNGRRVGDPLPLLGKASGEQSDKLKSVEQPGRSGNGGEQASTGRPASKPSERRSLSALGGGEAAVRGSRSLPAIPAMHSHHARSRGASSRSANAGGIASPSLLDSQLLPHFFPAIADYTVIHPVFRAAGFLFYPLAGPPQGPSPKIAFASYREGGAQIYLMNTDGSNQTRLTTSTANDEAPRWSPDNSRLLFQSDRDNPFSCLSEIYVMNADGSSQTRLTNDAADDSAPVWSPDGTKIVFQSARNGLYYQVYVMNADGSGQTNLSNGATNDGQPSWSLDGAKILFTSERDHPGTPGIYVMNADGSSQTRLTCSSSDVRDEQPMWSPDGMKIAFVSTRDSTVEMWEETDDEGGILVRTRIRTNKEVYLMNADGSNQVRLTNTLENDDSPAWSSDGTKIVFRSDRERECCDPVAQVWTMNTDGSNQADLSNNQVGDYSPGWQRAEGNALPSVSVTSPANGATSTAPANITIIANASDGDGTISKVDFYNGPTLLGTVTSSPYSFTWNNVAVGTYSLTAKATDNSGGVTTSASVSITVNPNQPSGDQFVGSFHQWALLRQPNAEEQPYWDDILRIAYARGQSSMVMAARELGKTLFESAQYADRGRNDNLYVYDLYKTYLMREPDSGGWVYWESMVPSQGREAVRRAFDESAEFINVVATITPTGSASSTVSSLLSARVDPQNQPGSGLLGRDAEWSLPLLSLPGRSGLDLGLALSYSSMVWTRSGPYIYFDEDNGSPSPGFRLGFPTIQELFFDAQVGQNAYVLITPGGSRTELRQVGSSTTYEAADSSYLQLIDYGSTLLVRSTDGTQLSYTKQHNEWRCNQIKDRNGNYITVNYNWLGQITTIIDTLARLITFNYDGNANLLSITQTWTVNGVPQTHQWATFGWGPVTMQSGFSGVSVVGAPNGSTIPVLNQVGLADGSRHTFEYSSAGQVSIIKRFAAPSDTTPRAYTAYDYQSSTDDCPRLSATRVSAENWTGINGVPTEVVTQYGDADEGWHQLIAPDGTIYKELYGASWQRGLPTQTEVWSASVRQKWTTTNWTQDNTGVNYQTNPRVTETNVYDSGGNRRRTTIGYYTFTLPSGSQCNLPSDVKEYQSDATTVYRRRHTDYNLDAAYLSRGIIGLPGAVFVCDGAGEPAPCGNGSGAGLISKVEYQYDANGEFLQSQGATVQHDETNYTAEFVAGRGNLTSIRRWNAEAPADASQALESRLGYNTNGSVIFARDPLGHANRQTSISYADSFAADGTNLDAPRSFAALAFPTTVTDADGHSSYVRYHYDFGAKTRVQGPPPDNQPQGLIQTFAYDGAGRMDRVTTTNNGAYRRFVYGPNYVQQLGSVNNIGDDSYAIQVFDGAGRAIAAAGNHPGSAGGYSAVVTLYDLMGRAIRQSNPTETTASGSPWPATGDDAYNAQTGAGDWRYTEQTYDWQGRPRITTNTDGTTKEAGYSGCGCAGGEVVTLTDEVGRRQKVYSDVLGRTAKSEVLNSDGSVYSAATNVYNPRDQVTFANAYSGLATSDGSCPTGTCQQTSLTYDGYGRPKTKHAPQQDAGAATTWDYFNDDTVRMITDARGASATYSYNGRRQATSITYAAPSGITLTSNVYFAYDASGNRSSMTDGSGSTTHQYDQLSRLTSESRAFAGLSGSYTLSYSYNLANELTSITDPFNTTVNYGYDQTGRLSNVTGVGFPNVSQFATNLQYRASGSAKNMTYGNGNTLAIGYNARLLPTSYQIPGVMDKTYQYYDDSSMRFAGDALDNRYDRSWQYDHVGRIAVAKTGDEARGGSAADGPFRQSYQYDPFGHTTNSTSRQWSTGYGDTGSYVNERRVGWSYDADGNALSNGEIQFTYDAAGQPTRTVNTQGGSISSNTFDGDGQRVKNAFQPNSSYTATTKYYLRATPLDGEEVAEILSTGEKIQGCVYAGDTLLARQRLPVSGDVSDYIVWEHTDASGSSVRATTPTGAPTWPTNQYAAELDSVNANMALEDPHLEWPPPLPPDENSPEQPGYGNPTRPSTGCTFNGMPLPDCDFMKGSLFFSNPFNQLDYAVAESIAPSVLSQTRTHQPSKQRKPPTLKTRKLSDKARKRNRKQIEDARKGNVKNNEDEPQNTGEFSDPTSRIRIIDTGGDTVFERNKSRILRKIEFMVNSGPCNAAFKRAGRPSPFELVNGGKVTLSSTMALTDSSYDSTLGIPDAIRKSTRDKSGPARTLRNDNTGNAIIFFGANAFDGTYDLDEAIPHEFIHVGGIGSMYGFWGLLPGGNDLSGFDRKAYADIMANCKDH